MVGQSCTGRNQAGVIEETRPMNYTKDLSEDWAEMIKDTAERCLLYAVLVIFAVVGGFVLALKWGWFR